MIFTHFFPVFSAYDLYLFSSYDIYSFIWSFSANDYCLLLWSFIASDHPFCDHFRHEIIAHHFRQFLHMIMAYFFWSCFVCGHYLLLRTLPACESPLPWTFSALDYLPPHSSFYARDRFLHMIITHIFCNILHVIIAYFSDFEYLNEDYCGEIKGLIRKM